MENDTRTHGEKVSAARRESAVVKAYLTALRGGPRERRLDPDVVRARIERINEQLLSADVIGELKLVQERMNLEAELSRPRSGPDRAQLEAAFIEVAGRFSARKGIRYETWREVGVEPRVLRLAGVRPTKP